MNVKRWTICLVRSHRWTNISYGDHDDSGFFQRCLTCDYENHKGAGVRPTGGAF